MKAKGQRLWIQKSGERKDLKTLLFFVLHYATFVYIVKISKQLFKGARLREERWAELLISLQFPKLQLDLCTEVGC
jgi:hypothetical protein